MLYSTFLFAILGLLVPGLSYFYQKRLFQEEESKLANTVSAKIAEAKADLLKELTAQTKSELEKNQVILSEKAAQLENKAEERGAASDMKIKDALDSLEREIDRSKGSIFHVQMNVNINSENFENAFTSACDALACQILARDFLNLRRVGTSLSQQILPKIDSATLQRCENEGFQLIDITARIEKLGSSGEFADLCRDIRLAHKAAEKRKSN